MILSKSVHTKNHSHDAISVILAPNSKFSSDISHEMWSSLIHKS